MYLLSYGLIIRLFHCGCIIYPFRTILINKSIPPCNLATRYLIISVRMLFSLLYFLLSWFLKIALRPECCFLQVLLGHLFPPIFNIPLKIFNPSWLFPIKRHFLLLSFLFLLIFPPHHTSLLVLYFHSVLMSSFFFATCLVCCFHIFSYFLQLPCLLVLSFCLSSFVWDWFTIPTEPVLNSTS